MTCGSNSEECPEKTATGSVHVIGPGLALLAVLAGCGTTPFDVNVSTDEPIEVNLNMEVHVYRHGQADEDTQEAQASYREVMKRRRDRMAEIQELKNNRLVGENREGLLSIRNLTLALILQSPNSILLSVLIFFRWDAGQTEDTAAIGIVMLVITLAMSVALRRASAIGDVAR